MERIFSSARTVSRAQSGGVQCRAVHYGVPVVCYGETGGRGRGRGGREEGGGNIFKYFTSPSPYLPPMENNCAGKVRVI